VWRCAAGLVQVLLKTPAFPWNTHVLCQCHAMTQQLLSVQERARVDASLRAWQAAAGAAAPSASSCGGDDCNSATATSPRRQPIGRATVQAAGGTKAAAHGRNTAAARAATSEGDADLPEWPYGGSGGGGTPGAAAAAAVAKGGRRAPRGGRPPAGARSCHGKRSRLATASVAGDTQLPAAAAPPEAASGPAAADAAEEAGGSSGREDGDMPMLLRLPCTQADQAADAAVAGGAAANVHGPLTTRQQNSHRQGAAQPATADGAAACQHQQESEQLAAGSRPLNELANRRPQPGADAASPARPKKKRGRPPKAAAVAATSAAPSPKPPAAEASPQEYSSGSHRKRQKRQRRLSADPDDDATAAILPTGLDGAGAAIGVPDLSESGEAAGDAGGAPTGGGFDAALALAEHEALMAQIAATLDDDDL